MSRKKKTLRFRQRLPFFPCDGVGVGKGVSGIRVFFNFFHAVGKSGGIGADVGVFHVGVENVVIRVLEGPVADGAGGFLGVALALEALVDVVADLGENFAVDVLQGDAAVADEFAGGFQGDGQQAEAVFLVVIQVPGDPAPCLLSCERGGVVGHGLGVGENFIQRVKILHGVRAQKQARGFNGQGNHILFNRVRGLYNIKFTLSSIFRRPCKKSLQFPVPGAMIAVRTGRRQSHERHVHRSTVFLLLLLLFYPKKVIAFCAAMLPAGAKKNVF